MKILTLRKYDIEKTVSLHIKALPETTSSKIGESYLRQIYRTIYKNKKNNSSLVALKNGSIVGVITATSDLKLLGDQFKGALTLKDYFSIIKSLTTNKITLKELFQKYIFEKELIKNYKKKYLAITVLFVNKDSRKKGIGKKLVLALIRNYEKTGENIYVDTLSINVNAIGFYKSLGFKTIKKIKDSTLLIFETYR